ncbi:leucine rich repeat family protein [Cyclospora cayetanensis]|uniref:Leucine rich repeat family protein n=1 Tax=Cyclospora cayetanensis TaxID=88456 RepID=A0A1D3CU20_9EIME|nr:leucine rich repeat family protein [Cyclospora cayetanensis]
MSQEALLVRYLMAQSEAHRQPEDLPIPMALVLFWFVQPRKGLLMNQSLTGIEDKGDSERNAKRGAGVIAADKEATASQSRAVSAPEPQQIRPSSHPQQHLRLIGKGLASLSDALLCLPQGASLSCLRTLTLHANSLVSLDVRRCKKTLSRLKRPFLLTVAALQKSLDRPAEGLQPAALPQLLQLNLPGPRQNALLHPLHSHRTPLTVMCSQCVLLPWMQGVSALPHLEELRVSSNLLQRLGDLRALRRLRLLDVASNRLQSVEGLTGLCSLRCLRAELNQITCLASLQQLWGPEYQLETLDLRENHLTDFRKLLFLGGLARLKSLALQHKEGKMFFPLKS